MDCGLLDWTHLSADHVAEGLFCRVGIGVCLNQGLHRSADRISDFHVALQLEATDIRIIILRELDLCDLPACIALYVEELVFH